MTFYEAIEPFRERHRTFIRWCMGALVSTLQRLKLYTVVARVWLGVRDIAA